MIFVKKKDVFSLLTNQTRNAIITRLLEAKQAAYSDLMDTTNKIYPIQSTGNLNYHLNFLLDNEIIVKDGSVYKLSDKGREITRFITEIDLKWKDIVKILRGDTLSVFNLAEQFEEETGHNMSNVVNEFMGSKIIMDEKQVFGLMNEFDEEFLIEDYIELEIDGLKIKRLIHEQESGIAKTYYVLEHPKINYFLSPKYFGLLQDFSERNFGSIKLFAKQTEIAPFIIKAENKSNSMYFILAPSAIDPIDSPKKK